MTTMTDARAVEVLAAMREDGGVVADADYTAAIDRAVARLREPVGVGGDWVLVKRRDLERSAETLDSDGDEYGVAHDLLAMIAFAPQLPAKVQAQGGGEGCAHHWHDYGQMNVSWCHKCEAKVVTGYEDRPFTAPPSAPVGVEAADIADRLRNIALIMRGFGGTERIDGKVWERVTELADRLDSLAQQPGGSDND